MVKMLKQVQHDGRVGIIGFTESVINGRHPELVSGSLFFKTVIPPGLKFNGNWLKFKRAAAAADSRYFERSLEVFSSSIRKHFAFIISYRIPEGSHDYRIK
jgi:hypothetical protein